MGCGKMISSRAKLNDKLTTFANQNGLLKVYFCPPTNVVMKYPCIVYEQTGVERHAANNHRYLSYIDYEIKIITGDADSSLPFLLEDCLQSECGVYEGRRYVADNLHHYVVNCKTSLL